MVLAGEWADGVDIMGAAVEVAVAWLDGSCVGGELVVR